MNGIDQSEFLDFLLQAKRHTYAAGDRTAIVEKSMLPGTTQLDWSSGKWLYRDVYYGGTRFCGLETVFLDNAPAWSMCYFGGMKPGISGELTNQTYKFLQKALSLSSHERPYRGPESHIEENWTYQSSLTGKLENFEGNEEIQMSGQSCYALSFTGGMIS
jgi:hypothetical protein